MRQSFFSALCSAYYAVFVPCCFAPSSIYIDVWWACELSKGGGLKVEVKIRKSTVLCFSLENFKLCLLIFKPNYFDRL